MSSKLTINYLQKRINEAKHELKRINGFKSDVTKKLKSNQITNAEAQLFRKRLQDAANVLKNMLILMQIKKIQ